ncbi:MAG: hypothetical protein HFH03_11935 [Dorea sp.]|jgi:hypothetical protein|nr:hypothetical protein [Dorea sp.]
MDIKNARKKKPLFFIWVQLGLIISFVLCSILMSGNSSIYLFYNVGDVYEISNNIYDTPNQPYGYGITIKDNKNQWNYFCVDIKNKDIVNWNIAYEKRENEEVIKSRDYDVKLHSGMNLLDVPKNSFNMIKITIADENKAAYTIKNMQLRENKPTWNFLKAAMIFCMSFIIYTFGSGIILLFWRRIGITFDLYTWVEMLQDIYIVFGRQLSRIIRRFPLMTNYRNVIRIVSFLMIFLYSFWVEASNLYFPRFKYHVIIYSFLILIIALASIESDMKRKKWNKILSGSWLILWGMACVSDFLIPKEFRFVGYAMILVIGFYIFVWNNMKNASELLKDFSCAVHIFFVLMTIFCLLFRPETMGIRYTGFSKNPSVFALHLGTFWAVTVSELEFRIRRKHNFTKILPFILEACVIIVFIWKAQSACPLLCMLGIAFIWFVKTFYFARKEDIYKNFRVVMISFMILLIPVYMGIDWGINNIPHKLGRTITFVGEESSARIEYGMVVHASDLKEKFERNRLVQKFSRNNLSGMLSGRDYYYRAFLRDMNLFGHKKRVRVWGYERLPHNAIIAIAHRYGVFASIPYIVMLITVISRTFKYSKRKSEYAAMPFYVCLSTIVMSMVDNVELPFIWLPWFGLYLMMGVVFVKHEEILSNVDKK